MRRASKPASTRIGFAAGLPPAAALALLPAAALALLPATAEAARFERRVAPSAPSVVEHSLGGQGPAFRLELRRIPGELHRRPGAPAGLLDFADYDRAGELVVHRSLALGPLAEGPAIVPPGVYAVSLSHSGPEGLAVFRLASSQGLRLRIPMVAAPRPQAPPSALTAEALTADASSSSVPVAIHLPTASGLLLVGTVELLTDSPLRRHRSKTSVIEEEMKRRALEGGPVRNLQRRERRGSQVP